VRIKKACAKKNKKNITACYIKDMQLEKAVIYQAQNKQNRHQVIKPLYKGSVWFFPGKHF
jgi:hypothetical protein